MKQEQIEFSFQTPAFIYNEEFLLKAIESGVALTETKCNLLYSLKSLAIWDFLHLIAQKVEGFSASSLFEARLARTVLGNRKSVHMTTPGLRPDEITVIAELCDYISFNSLTQWKRYHKEVEGKASCGIRINPELSFVKDERYNPCRTHSKLGVPLSILRVICENRDNQLEDVRGLHFHTNCESTNFAPLLETVLHIAANVPQLMERIQWINLGGGYLLEEYQDVEKFLAAVDLLKNRYGIKVFFEPGKAIIGDAGYVVSSVIDIFENGRKTIAILDTSVNHMPEVFEYQYRPEITQESEEGRYWYTLAGCTCLAGDLFGDYRFREPLEIGSRIVFEGMGAYTLVKAHMFNGVNLPTIYALTTEGKLELKKRFSYEDFKSRCGA